MSAFEISSELKSTFLVKKSQIEGRLDPNFNYLNSIVQQKLNTSKYPVRRLIDGIDFIQYGTSSLASKEEIGCPVIIPFQIINVVPSFVGSMAAM